MDHHMKSSLFLEKAEPQQRIRVFESLRDLLNDKIYRFEVTYGLYVMDFWGKSIVYAFIAIAIAFAMWQAIIPLCVASYRTFSRKLILEPKGFYSSIQPSPRAYSTAVLISSVVGNFNGSTTALLW
ncbi:uncharacterized protein J3D65DRAFT_601262 [Phyllosticta citribraziliensis]|uniref:Uncharacterized protein n=1 Tax=Phyllosticta citribraziliensis TaxID=989973 RepID=A0ABR1M4A0_9PEZI